jgi:hypothetical protein
MRNMGNSVLFRKTLTSRVQIANHAIAMSRARDYGLEWAAELHSLCENLEFVMPPEVSTHQAEEDARNEEILIYVNGKILPKAQATVSVYDSGFMLGDGVWEGVRLYNGKWTFLQEHVDRLFEAAKALAPC